MLEQPRGDSSLKGMVRYGRVIPLGGIRTLSIEWAEEYNLSETTAEKVTFSLESRMKRTLQDAGLIQ
jgi:hypothetical protein